MFCGADKGRQEQWKIARFNHGSSAQMGTRQLSNNVQEILEKPKENNFVAHK